MRAGAGPPPPGPRARRLWGSASIPAWVRSILPRAPFEAAPFGAAPFGVLSSSLVSLLPKEEDVPRRFSSWILPSALALLAGTGHVLYPAWLLTGPTRKLSTPPVPPEPPEWPPVTVVVPAYREAGVIGRKVESLGANGYPGAVEVVVVADGDAETAEAAARSGARVIRPRQRLGKPAAMNLGVAEASHDICVLTDANNSLSDGALAALVRWFSDSRVGAVAGEKTEVNAGGEGLYWRFESWLKQREFRQGTTIGVVGELFAVRREAWQPIAEEVAADDLWLALDVSARHWRIAYEPAARSYEPPVSSLSESWERRTRIAAGALYVLWRYRDLLRSVDPYVRAQVWGHRLARYTVGPLAHVALVGVLARRAPRSPAAAAILAAHVAAAALVLTTPQQLPAPKKLRSVSHVLYLQAVALGGMVRFLRGDRYSKWPTIDR